MEQSSVGSKGQGVDSQRAAYRQPYQTGKQCVSVDSKNPPPFISHCRPNTKHAEVCSWKEGCMTSGFQCGFQCTLADHSAASPSVHVFVLPHTALSSVSTPHGPHSGFKLYPHMRMQLWICMQNLGTACDREHVMCLSASGLLSIIFLETP